jgi:hypothetical protein
MGETGQVHLPVGKYDPTYLIVHTHPPIPNRSVEGPSGRDLVACVKSTANLLAKGSVIRCPKSIWFIFPAADRIQKFTKDNQSKEHMIGYGHALNILFRLEVISLNEYLHELYHIGFDVCHHPI